MSGAVVEDFAYRTRAGIGLQVRAWLQDPADVETASDAETPALLLLHGIASNARTWDGAGRRLASAGWAAYAVDFRGHGLSDRPNGGYDLETFAEDVADVVHGLGLHRPILAGHSLGAAVILQMLTREPGIAGAVALVEGGLAAVRSQYVTFEECLARQALPSVGGLPLPHLRGYLRGSNPTWSDERLEAAMACFEVGDDGTAAWRLSGAHFESCLRALWEMDVAAAWDSLRVPALVLASDTGDAVWTAAKRAAQAVLVRSVSSARVEWLGSDHEVHSAFPEEVAGLLLDLAGEARAVTASN